MEIKPIKFIERVKSAEMPETKIDRQRPSIKTPVDLPMGRWQFFKGQVIINGQNITTLLDSAVDKPAAFWSQLSGELNVFLNTVLGRFPRRKKKKKINGREVEVDEEIDPSGELGQLLALTEAYIAKISRTLKRKYDEKTDGITFTLDEDGQLILNGMNVTSFVQASREYPSQKAKVFLNGLKNRLTIILSNRTGNNNYEKVRDATLSLFDEIDAEIKRILDKERLLEK